jgi:hypothetical protein
MGLVALCSLLTENCLLSTRERGPPPLSHKHERETSQNGGLRLITSHRSGFRPSLARSALASSISTSPVLPPVEGICSSVCLFSLFFSLRSCRAGELLRLRRFFASSRRSRRSGDRCRSSRPP